MNPALVAEMLKPRDEEIEELKRQKDALMEELENIATAEWREFDPDTRRCAYEFVLWAQSRARHTINRVLSGDVTAPLPEDVKLVQVGDCACSDHECGECMQPAPSKVGADGTAEPNCDRSACGDFKPGPCDHPDCPAIGKAPDDMIAMENAQGKKFALKLNPAHPQHGWIFYDNHGQWVTLRRALPHEIERAKGILEMRQVLAGVPCRA